MNLRRSAALAMACLFVAASAAACGATGAPTPAATATPAPSRIDVTGTMQCAGDPSAVSCELKMSDPRASGKQVYPLSVKEMPDGSLSEWSQGTLQSAGGAWDCKGAGSQAPNGILAIDQVCTGQAAFGPFVLYLHLTSGDGGDHWSATGSIERA